MMQGVNYRKGAVLSPFMQNWICCNRSRAIHGVDNPYGYGYGVGFGWVLDIFSWKVLGRGGVMGQRYQNVRKIPDALVLSLPYEIMAYLYIKHKITGFAKLTDMGGKQGIFYPKKWVWVEMGIFYKKKSAYGWIWIWPNGVEWSGS